MSYKPPREGNFATSRRNKNYVATQQLLRRDVTNIPTNGKRETIVAKFATMGV